jgi:hypothetical protein
MRILKTAGGIGALVGAALIGGTLISSTLAAARSATDPDAATVQAQHGILADGEHLDTYLGALAAELGVDRAALGPAALAAANATIDASLAAGDIDEDRATELKERLAGLEDPESLLAGRWILGHGPGGPGRGPGIGLGIAEAADAAAEALGIERAALVEALRDGTALEELAEQEGVAYDAVKQAVLEVATARLDDAVADEDITRERADEVLAAVTDWLDDGGEPRGGFRFIGGRGPRG